jgi:hypothetical protein
MNESFDSKNNENINPYTNGFLSKLGWGVNSPNKNNNNKNQ